MELTTRSSTNVRSELVYWYFCFQTRRGVVPNLNLLAQAENTSASSRTAGMFFILLNTAWGPNGGASGVNVWWRKIADRSILIGRMESIVNICHPLPRWGSSQPGEDNIVVSRCQQCATGLSLITRLALALLVELMLVLRAIRHAFRDEVIGQSRATARLCPNCRPPVRAEEALPFVRCGAKLPSLSLLKNDWFWKTLSRRRTTEMRRLADRQLSALRRADLAGADILAIASERRTFVGTCRSRRRAKSSAFSKPGAKNLPVGNLPISSRAHSWQNYAKATSEWLVSKG